MPLKTCGRCCVAKEHSAFGRNRSRKDGLQNYCNVCRKEYQSEPSQREIAKRREQRKPQTPEQKRLYNRNWRMRNPEVAKLKNRRSRLAQYGLTIEAFAALLAQQGGRCAICRVDEPRGRGWNVDHCHRSGRVRGILCGLCNQGIGQLADDPALCRAAAEYLEHT